jgi:hypothetical protein
MPEEQYDPKKDEDLQESLKEFKKIVKEIDEKRLDVEGNEGLRSKVKMFYDYHYQKELARSNRNLSLATWILALATIVLTVSTIYGAEATDTLLKQTTEIILIIVIIIIAIAVIFDIFSRAKGWLHKIIKKYDLKDKIKRIIK